MEEHGPFHMLRSHLVIRATETLSKYFCHVEEENNPFFLIKLTAKERKNVYTAFKKTQHTHEMSAKIRAN